jgi:hypothetical protein
MICVDVAKPTLKNLEDNESWAHDSTHQQALAPCQTKTPPAGRFVIRRQTGRCLPATSHFHGLTGVVIQWISGFQVVDLSIKRCESKLLWPNDCQGLRCQRINSFTNQPQKYLVSSCVHLSSMGEYIAFGTIRTPNIAPTQQGSHSSIHIAGSIPTLSGPMHTFVYPHSKTIWKYGDLSEISY